LKLTKTRIQNYRSIIDIGEVEDLKTIMVGPNEVGKTVIMRALQQLSKPEDMVGFDALRDYPRSKYNDITSKKVLPEDITVVTGWFKLDEDDKAAIPVGFQDSIYKRYKNIDNEVYHSLENAPFKIFYKDIRNDLTRLIAHLNKQYAIENPEEETKKPSLLLNAFNEN
jgi:predicted ATP-dependent endonuclease of OLD family